MVVFELPPSLKYAMAEIRKIEMSDLTARQLAQKITIHECFDEFFPWNDMKKKYVDTF